MDGQPQHDRKPDVDDVDERDAAAPDADGAYDPAPAADLDADEAMVRDDAPRAIHLDERGEPDMSDEPHDELGAVTEAVLHPEHDELKKGNAWVRWGMYAVGLGLLLACIVYAFRKLDWSKIHAAQAWQIWSLLGLAAVAIFLNAVMFMIATRPFEHDERKRIGMAEWIAIMGASALLNYLPKVGLIGRAVYLKKCHGIAYRGSLLSMLMVAGGTMAVYAVLVAASLWRDAVDGVWWAVVGGTLLVGIAVALPVIAMVLKWFKVGEMKRGMTGGLAIWTLARLGDSFCFAGRFYIAADLLGAEVTFAHALVLAMASNFVEMVGPLGFREAIGGWLSSRTGMTGAQGVTVLLIDRLALTVIVAILGFSCMPYLKRRLAEASGVEAPVGPPAIT
ncbi:MAG: hypothetical protein GC159_14220 [Phycisphaera sp.]|nr:hypothetical protein [Phycisphaera sp.]